MAKKKTAYTRERNRIMNYIRSLNRKGLYSDLYFPTEKQIRAEGVKGKELASLTRELKKWTSKELKSYVEAEYEEKQTFVPSSDNVLEQGISEIIVRNFKSDILRFPKQIADKIIALVNTIISEQGVDSVAYSLQHMPMQFYEYIRRQGYDSDSSVQEFSSTLIEYLPDASNQYKLDLMDAFENNELGYYVED